MFPREPSELKASSVGQKAPLQLRDYWSIRVRASGFRRKEPESLALSSGHRTSKLRGFVIDEAQGPRHKPRYASDAPGHCDCSRKLIGSPV